MNNKNITDMKERPQALVIGGSISGLLAAQVLSRYFQEVTIVERDQLPAEPSPRKGVPQARHIHILLLKGLQILRRLFPGLDQELAADGAVALNWTEDVRLLTPGGWARRYPSDLVSYACSRDLLEYQIRRRLLENKRVTFLTGQEASGLLATADHQMVNGLLLRPRGKGGSNGPRRLMADLIVDASGRSSKASKWLAALGYETPEETVVNASLGYATRWYEAPLQPGWKALVINARPPDFSRGAGLLPAEGGRWVLTLTGNDDDQPPTDEASFMSFLASLPDRSIYEFARSAKPVTPIAGYRRTENRWKHFEKLPEQPEGFVVMGDAACAFNPIYGQGMSAAAMGADLLDQCLRRNPLGDNFAKGFQQRLAKINQLPWTLATAEDFRWPNTVGDHPGWLTRLMHRYIDRVVALIPKDVTVGRSFLEVMHLLEGPQHLIRPAVSARVLLAMFQQGDEAAQKEEPVKIRQEVV